MRQLQPFVTSHFVASPVCFGTHVLKKTMEQAKEVTDALFSFATSSLAGWRLRSVGEVTDS